MLAVILLALLQVVLTMTALVASGAARNWAKDGQFQRAETAATVSFCLFVVLGVAFLCSVSADLRLLSAVLIGLWVILALREWWFADHLPA